MVFSKTHSGPLFNWIDRIIRKFLAGGGSTGGDAIALRIGEAQSQYLPLSFDFEGYEGRLDDAEVVATFTGDSSFVHPFFHEGNNTTFTANTRLPDGEYEVSITVDGEEIELENSSIEYSYGWSMSDFIRDHETEPQLAVKGGEPFYPAGFNGQYGTNLIDEDDPDYSETINPLSGSFDPKTYGALITAMAEYPEWNYLRFNFSNDLHLLNDDGHGQAGLISRTAVDYIEEIFSQCERNGIGFWTVFFHRGGLNQLLLLWDNSPSPFSSIQIEEWNEAWAASPWNSANGGPLNHPRELLSNETATGYFKNALRYAVARWGYHTGWMVRELCAEVYLWGHNDDDSLPSGKDDLIAWYEDLKDYMESIDPYGQWISTGDGGTGEVQHNGANMDIVNSHLHHNPPSKSKVVSLSGDPQALYAVYNHYEHPQSSYVDLESQKYINGSLGNGQFVRSNFGLSQLDPDFGLIRAKHDRHGYWENAFSGACGIGCSWDTGGWLAQYDTPALNYAAPRFAKLAKFHEETHTPINDLTTDAGFYAIGMQNANRTAVYLFDIQDNGSGNPEDGYFLQYSSDCPSRTGVGVTVPVSFAGSFTATAYDCDTAEVLASSSGTVSGGNAVIASLPSFKRAVAIIVQPSS